MKVGFRLPLLEPQRRALENCGYCPKLCRATCPVSNAEPRETITPWGKMTTALQVARGISPLDEAHARPAWACTGCHACKERCDHDNVVADALYDFRAEIFRANVLPAAARAVIENHARRLDEHRQSILKLDSIPGVSRSARTALLIGCNYVRHLHEEARDIVRSSVALFGSVRLVDACCGLSLRQVGDTDSAYAARDGLLARLGGIREVVVADPGCARFVDLRGAKTLVSVLSERRHLLRRLPELSGAPFRYHDPCQLARGLGIIEEPRLVLETLLGEAPGEFEFQRRDAHCSGGGGILPLTMPGHSVAIADERIAEHARTGGGTIVTACATSLKRFRSRGAKVRDLVSLAAAGLTR